MMMIMIMIIIIIIIIIIIFCCGMYNILPSEYINRHNKVAGYNHWMICKHVGLQVTDKYHEHK